MKKTIFMLAACAFTVMASAQIFEVQSVEKLEAASFENARVAGISPKGDYILMTTGTTKGLQRYDLQTGKITTISKAENAGLM